jgi:hypothetical protein
MLQKNSAKIAFGSLESTSPATVSHFQDLTVCAIRLGPSNAPTGRI